MTQTAAAINDYYKKIANECSDTQGNKFSNYDFQTIDTSVLLSAGLISNSSNSHRSSSNTNGSGNNNGDDQKTFSGCGALWTSFMGSLPLPPLPTSLDGPLTMPLVGSLPDPIGGSSALPTGGSLPMSMADAQSLAAIGSLHTTNVVNIGNNVGDMIDVDSCCMCNVCSAMFRNNTELVEHLKTHLLKEEKEGFMCILCGNEYRHKYNLKRHLKKVHQIAHDQLPRYVDDVVVDAPLTERVTETVGGQFLAQGVDIEGGSSTFYQSVMQMQPPTEQLSIGDNQYNNEDSVINISDNENNDSISIMNNTNNIDFLSKNFDVSSNDSNKTNSNSSNNKVINSSIKSNNNNDSTSTTGNSTTSSSNNNDKVPCFLCGKMLSNKWSLKRHLHLVHKFDAEEPQLKKQPKSTESGKPTSLVCPICQKQFLDNGVYDTDMHNTAAVALRAHLDECHPLDVSVETTSETGVSSVFSDIDDTAISMLNVLQ